MISAVAVKLEVVALRDGSTVSIRQTGPDDEPLLLAFFESLSEESRASRFFSAAADLSAAAHAASVLRPDQGVGLAACASSDGRIVGHASYRSGRHGAAEVDFAVAEQFQGRGIATLLLGRLADIA
ncbi:MAG TPA: GNAT family N-acetyltransferase, partial [Chloroflexota bacterium]